MLPAEKIGQEGNWQYLERSWHPAMQQKSSSCPYEENKKSDNIFNP